MHCEPFVFSGIGCSSCEIAHYPLRMEGKSPFPHYREQCGIRSVNPNSSSEGCVTFIKSLQLSEIHVPYLYVTLISKFTSLSAFA